MRTEPEQRPMRPHAVNLQHRGNLVVTGVEDVVSFHEELILLLTSEGGMTVAGSGLHIGALNLVEGTLTVEGRIDAIAYDDSVRAKRGSLFGRLFK